jgi:Holliday junction DNA helicase RuvA
MIEYIEGMLADKTPSAAVIDVGGVGFNCMISLSTFDELPQTGSKARLWTHLQIREEQPVLYGFAAVEERWLFRHLISVNGVGPKLAITILSGARAAVIREAIAHGDSGRLKSVRGIGAKIADRIVLELQKKLSMESPATPGVPLDAKSAALRQAIDALVALGIRQSEAENAVAETAKRGVTGVEELIKQSLRKS